MRKDEQTLGERQGGLHDIRPGLIPTEQLNYASASHSSLYSSTLSENEMM